MLEHVSFMHSAHTIPHAPVTINLCTTSLILTDLLLSPGVPAGVERVILASASQFDLLNTSREGLRLVQLARGHSAQRISLVAEVNNGLMGHIPLMAVDSWGQLRLLPGPVAPPSSERLEVLLQGYTPRAQEAYPDFSWLVQVQEVLYPRFQLRLPQEVRTGWLLRLVVQDPLAHRAPPLLTYGPGIRVQEGRPPVLPGGGHLVLRPARVSFRDSSALLDRTAAPDHRQCLLAAASG